MTVADKDRVGIDLDCWVIWRPVSAQFPVGRPITPIKDPGAREQQGARTDGPDPTHTASLLPNPVPRRRTHFVRFDGRSAGHEQRVNGSGGAVEGIICD